MPTPQYTALAAVTLNANTANILFSSISQNYKDLMLVVNWLSNGSGASQFALRYNSDTGSNYRKLYIVGNGSTASNGGADAETSADTAYMASASSTVPVTVITNVFDYSATDKHKNTISRSSDSAGQVIAYTTRWSNNSAITSLQVYSITSNVFLAGSTISLYGVK